MSVEPYELDRREIYRYLGCGQRTPPEELQGQVDWGCEAVCAAAETKALWRTFPLSGTALTGTALTLQGEDIARHLDRCSQCVLMAVTLGVQVERLLMRWEVRDLSRAMVLDACASCLVESECNTLEAELRQRFLSQGLYLTSRFSPGYGDLPLCQQGQVCQLLDAHRRAGLTLSPTGLMIPRKSVTAVLGLSAQPVSGHRAGCQHCALRGRCSFVKGGVTCA